MIERTPVRVQFYQVTHKCHACEDGHMQSTGQSYGIGMGNIHVHHCDKCGAIGNYPAIYPRLEQEVE